MKSRVTPPYFSWSGSTTRWHQGFADGIKGRSFRYAKPKKRRRDNSRGASPYDCRYWTDYKSGFSAGQREKHRRERPSLWCRYRSFIWGGLAFITTCLFLISFLSDSP